MADVAAAAAVATTGLCLLLLLAQVNESARARIEEEKAFRDQFRRLNFAPNASLMLHRVVFLHTLLVLLRSLLDCDHVWRLDADTGRGET